MARVILIVLDSVGIGALPDAAKYGDEGSDTLGHIIESIPEFDLPNLRSMGLGNIEGVEGFSNADSPSGAFGRAREHAAGKDTTTGHWEIAGLHHDLSFPYFPNGFPQELMSEFESRIGTGTLGNKVASGTVIIDELAAEHFKTGYPIVYTSADSVFQIAMHEDVIPLERQYEICNIARDLLVGDNAVARVIARPFVGTEGNYKRTPNRKDFSLEPPGKTILDLAVQQGLPVTGVGKIKDIFAGQGVSISIKTTDNSDGIDKTIAAMSEDSGGLIFTNLVDFDMLYGHRRDVQGYGEALMLFDRRLPEIQAAMREEDVLILTADHGNDPVHTGTDHTREHVPILVFGDSIQSGAAIGTRNSFADIGATIADILKLGATSAGQSFYDSIRN